MTLNEIKSILEGQKPHLRAGYGVTEIGVFGSYVRGGETKKSDLDILVDFNEPISLIKFIELENYLSEHIGLKVDLVMKDALKPRIGRRILQEAVMV